MTRSRETRGVATSGIRVFEGFRSRRVPLITQDKKRRECQDLKGDEGHVGCDREWNCGIDPPGQMVVVERSRMEISETSIRGLRDADLCRFLNGTARTQAKAQMAASALGDLH
jgi:hypothetical protein